MVNELLLLVQGPPPVPPSLPEWVYELRLLFIFTSILLCTWVTGVFFWLAYQMRVQPIGGHRYKLIPYMATRLGAAVFIDSLIGYLGYIIWQFRDLPEADGDYTTSLLFIPIIGGLILFMIGDAINLRQYGRSYVWLLSIRSRKRENHLEQ